MQLVKKKGGKPMRTEEEIKKRLRFRKLQVTLTPSISDLEWALEDSEPKPIEDIKVKYFICPHCDTVWHDKKNMERLCCPELKPIKKVSCGSNISVVEIAIRLNEMIDRLSELTKSKE